MAWYLIKHRDKFNLSSGNYYLTGLRIDVPGHEQFQ